MDRNPSASAGDVGSVLDPRRSRMLRSNLACATQLLILHSRGGKPPLLSPQATPTEPALPRACAPQQEKPPRSLRTAPREQPWLTATAEKPAHRSEQPAESKKLISKKDTRKRQQWSVINNSILN